MERSQIGNLQIIRAIAALSVVLDHTFATSLKKLTSDGVYEYVHTFFNQLGAFGVYVFFVLSGFLMIFTQKENRTSYRFIRDRVIRIYPSYIIYSFPIIVYSIFSTKYDHQINNVYQFIMNIILMPSWGGEGYTNANYPAWTLVYEMFFYIVFSMLLVFTKDKKKIAMSMFVILIVLIVISRDIVKLNSDTQHTDLSFLFSNPVLLNFAVGCGLGAFFNINNRKLNRFLFMVATVILFLVSPFIMTLFTLSSQKNIANIVFGTLPAAMIVLISLNSKELKNNLMKMIGNASYTIYLIHVTLIIIKNKIFNILGIVDSLYMVVFFNFIFIPVVLLVGMVLYRMIEEPIVKKFKACFISRNERIQLIR